MDNTSWFMPLNGVCKYRMLPTALILQTANARDGGMEMKQVTNIPPVRELLVAITSVLRRWNDPIHGIVSDLV